MRTTEQTPPAPPRTVFLLDDHEVVRRGITGMIAAAPDLAVVGEAATAAEALEQVTDLRPEVALLDVVLPDGSGVEVCRELRSRSPEVQCLMLTAHDEGEAFFAAVMGGACGWLTKQLDTELLIDSVRRAARGERLLDPTMVSTLLERLRNAPELPDTDLTLTERQQRILDLVAAGRSDAEIAAELSVRERTVKTQIALIFARTGLARTMRAAEDGGRPWFDIAALADLTLDDEARNRLTP